MGWSGGSELFREVIKAAVKAIPDNKARKSFYKDIIPAFEDNDWDTQNECLGRDSAYDDAMWELYPDDMRELSIN